MMIDDFTKIECPFVRKTYEIDKVDWKKHGSKMGLREPSVYLVTPEINEGYDWVVDHKDTTSIEKLHGSNLGIVTEKDRLIHIQNRKNVVDPFQINGGRAYMMEGIFAAVEKGYIEKDGIQYGEIMGPKINGNIYRLPQHLWYPFNKARESLKYKSFHTQPKGFWPWSEWFRVYLKSILYCRLNKIPLSDMHTNPEVPVPEGVVFYNDTVSVCDKPRMAKLRVDMFPWHYWDKIHIIGLEDHWLEYAKEKGMTPKGYGEILLPVEK
jgi:hypothetical protein